MQGLPLPFGVLQESDVRRASPELPNHVRVTDDHEEDWGSKEKDELVDGQGDPRILFLAVKHLHRHVPLAVSVNDAVPALL